MSVRPLRMAEDDPVFQQLEADLMVAFWLAKQGKAKTRDEADFEMYLIENIHQLALDIYFEHYEPSPGIAFVDGARNGVMREIYAAQFRDRVVHHYICGYTAGWWDRHLIYDAASCRKGKGTLFAQKRMQTHMRRASLNMTRRIGVYKGDLAGFFMSLVKKKLLGRAWWGLERQFPEGSRPPQYHILRFLWQQTLLNDPTKGVIYKGDSSDWERLLENKILAKQPEGQGIVIGNLTSQWISNAYLDLLDRFITLRLGYKHYGRYVDDFYVVVPEEERAQFERDLVAIKNYLETVLELKLNLRKSQWYENVNRGVPFLGEEISPRRRVPGKRIRQNYHQIAFEFLEGWRSAESLRSYEGLLTHCQGKGLIEHVYRVFGFDRENQLHKR